MSYPDRYNPAANLARDEQRGLGTSGVKLDAEYARIAASITQLVSFVKRFTTSDGKLKLDQAVRVNDVITEDLFSGTGLQFTFSFAQAIDSGVDLVRVWVNGVRTDPISFTDVDFTMAVAPPVGVNNVEVRIYTNIAGVLDRVQSILFDEGAFLVGYADPEGKYTADNVQDALTEVKGLYDQLILDLGDVGGFLLRNGSRTLTGQWELNENTEVIVAPAAAVGSFVLSGQPADGDFITVSDGSYVITFEFDTNAVVTPGNVSVTIGATVDDTLQNFVAVLNSGPLAVVADYSGSTVSLENEVPYALGNVPLVSSGATITAVAGMSGGVDGSFGPALRTHYRVRNSPPSLRDGDAVVHQQLNQVATQIAAALGSFLRLDGANQMVGPLNFGGNSARNMADGVFPAEGVNKSQLDAAIITAKAGKLSTIGLKDTVADGTLTGPVSLGQLASALADADQTTTPAAVAVQTLTGVPQPTSNDQVTNKLYVDVLVAATITPTNRPIPQINFEGDGVGGPTDIGSLVAGGVWYTESLGITAPQAFTTPIKIFVDGDFNTSGLGTLTSAYAIEIEAIGDVTIAAAITCPYLTIRAGGNVTINAAVDGHDTYTLPVLYPIGFASRPEERITADRAWRLIRVDSNSNITITAALQSDDILLYALGDVTIAATLRAYWLRQAGNLAGVQSGSWFDGYQGNAIGGVPVAVKAGAGGTAGGAGVNAALPQSPASIWRTTRKPWLLPFRFSARGGGGGQQAGTVVFGDGLSGRGGGRILVYCNGDAILTTAILNANGGHANAAGGGPGSDPGGGGGGTVRVVCMGTVTNGDLRANGGQSIALWRGGGGMAVFVASLFAGVQATTALGYAAAYNGTTGAFILAATDIEALRNQGLFEVRWQEGLPWP